MIIALQMMNINIKGKSIPKIIMILMQIRNKLKNKLNKVDDK